MIIGIVQYEYGLWALGVFKYRIVFPCAGYRLGTLGFKTESRPVLGSRAMQWMMQSGKDLHLDYQKAKALLFSFEKKR